MPESLVARARRLAPTKGRVEPLGDRGAYIELRDVLAGNVGGIVTAVICPDDRTMTEAWRQLEVLLAQRTAEREAEREAARKGNA